MDNSDLTRLQQGMVRFEQTGAANGVNQHRRIFDRAPFKVRAFAMPTDLKANHARTKRLKKHLGIAHVVAEVCDNESIRMVAAIDHGERAGTRTSVKSLRELLGLFNSH